MSPIADYNLGTAHGKISIDFDGSGVEQGERGLSRLRGQASTTRGAFDSAAKGMGVAGLAIGAGIGLAVKSAADFQAQLSDLKAVSGATGAQMDLVSKKALQLGKDTKFSAGDAALAMTELVKAGISVPDVLNGAADAAVNLAAAGGVELPEAAELAANAMNQFSLTAQELPKVADLIAGAANASAIDVHDFGESLKQVGAAAHLAGIGFDDTATAIALMGKAGIKGSDAGTSLKTFLLNLIPTTKRQKDLMKELGIITKEGGNQFFDAAGKAKPLAQISGVLQKALKGQTQQQKLATLQTLFGSDAIRAAAVLTQSGAKGFEDMSKAMSKVKAADVAKTKMDNLKGSIEQFKGSVETAGIAVGTVMLPILRKLVDGVTALVNKFLDLPKGAQQTILILATVAAGLLLLASGIIKVVFFAQKFVEALKLIRIAMAATFLTNPIFLVIAAIVALVVAIVLLWKHSETFRNIVTGTWNAVWNAIKTAVTAIVNFVKQWWPLILIIMTGGIAAIPVLIIKFWSQIKTAFMTAISFIVGITKTFFSTLWSIYVEGIKIITLPIRIWIGLVIGLFVLLYKALAIGARAFWALFGGPIRAALDGALAIIRGTLAIIRAVWSAVWGSLTTIVRTTMNIVLGIIRAVLGLVRTIWTSVWRAIGPIVISAFNGVIHTVGAATSIIWRGLKNLASGIIKIFSGAGKWLFSAGKAVLQGFWNGIVSIANWIKTQIQRLINAIVPGPVRHLLGIGSPSKLFRGFGQDTGRGFVLGLQDQKSMIARASADLATAAIPGIPTAQVAAATAGASESTTARSGGPSPTLNETGLAEAIVAALERRSISMAVITDSVNKTSGRQSNQRRRTG